MSDISSAARLGTSGVLRSYNIRSSGRDLNAVRRPARGIVGITAPVPEKGDVKVEEPAPEPKKNPEPKTSARKPESNDARVKTKKADRG